MDTNAIEQTAVSTAKPEDDPHYKLLLQMAEATSDLVCLIFRDKTLSAPINNATSRLSYLATSVIRHWEDTHGIPPWEVYGKEQTSKSHPETASSQTPQPKELPMRTEIKFTRANVTLDDFLASLRAMNVSYLDLAPDCLDWFTVPRGGGSSVSYFIENNMKHYTYNGHTTVSELTEPPAALKEICRDRAYDYECYVEREDGNIYHECLKFTHQNGIHGTGYFYLLEVRPGETNADDQTAATANTPQSGKAPGLDEPLHKIDWRLRFDDVNFITDQFLSKLKRRPTEADWEEISEKESMAMKHHIGLLKEQFGVVEVIEEDTRPDDDGNMAGTCLVTKELGLRLLRESDQDRKSYLFEDTELSKPGPSSQAAWNALHVCDCMTVAFDGFPDELIAEYEGRAK